MFEKLAKLKFQFYLSSIKRTLSVRRVVMLIEFQFYLSSIKSYTPRFIDLKTD